MIEQTGGTPPQLTTNSELGGKINKPHYYLDYNDAGRCIVHDFHFAPPFAQDSPLFDNYAVASTAYGEKINP